VEAIEAIESVLAPRSNVRLAYLFGSAARGRERASSDVDIAILFDGLPEPHELDRWNG
jgi:predicted nucleotidyltransferase